MAPITDKLDKNRREVRFRREIALSERVSIANESKFLLRSTASSATGSYRKSVFVEPQLHRAIFFNRNKLYAFCPCMPCFDTDAVVFVIVFIVIIPSAIF